MEGHKIYGFLPPMTIVDCDGGVAAVSSEIVCTPPLLVSIRRTPLLYTHSTQYLKNSTVLHQ